jgi:C4-dicarboxylate transporter
MSLYWISVAATLYMLGFFLPFIIQLLIEKVYNKNKKKYKSIMLRHKFIKSIILFFRRKNLYRSLSYSCFTMGILSLIFSNIAMLIFSHDKYDQMLSLFIGLWSPTLVATAVYLKK